MEIRHPFPPVAVAAALAASVAFPLGPAGLPAGPLAPAAAEAQVAGARGLQVEATGLWTLRSSQDIPAAVSGFGAGLGARYRWPSGVSLGVHGVYAFPKDEAIARDDPTRRMEELGVFTELRYHFSRLTPVRPYVGGRVGWTGLKGRDVSGLSANGFSYGITAGTEIWPTERVGLRFSSAAGGSSIGDLNPGRTSAGVFLTFEGGITVMLGETSGDADGDGVADRRDQCRGTLPGVPVDDRGCAADRDGDGVPDHADACLETPAGAEVNRRGCAADADGDGVPDGTDRCPGTPAGLPVDGEGCAPDADADGVPDGVDRCPDTPRGTPVDGRGCVADADGDGVPDEADLCPGTQVQEEVDEDGCSWVQSGMEAGEVVVPGLPFDFDAVSLREESRRALDEVGRRLAGQPDMRIGIRVYTDTVGPADYNQRLSQRLADVARDYLLENHPDVEPGQVEASGRGEADLDEAEPARGARRGSRIEIVVLEGGG